jgi:hypothetical protein
MRRYANWKSVNIEICLKGTFSTNEAWGASNILLEEDSK